MNMKKYKIYKIAFVTVEVEAEKAADALAKSKDVQHNEWKVSSFSKDYIPIVEEVEDVKR